MLCKVLALVARFGRLGPIQCLDRSCSHKVAMLGAVEVHISNFAPFGCVSGGRRRFYGRFSLRPSPSPCQCSPVIRMSLLPSCWTWKRTPSTVTSCLSGVVEF